MLTLNEGKNDAEGNEDKKAFKGGNSKPKKDAPNRRVWLWNHNFCDSLLNLC